MSTLHDTAVAVKALLDGATLSKAFDSRFVYDTNLPLEDADQLHVDIVIGGWSQVPNDRASVQNDVGIDIAVRYRFGTIEQDNDGSIAVDEIGPYLNLLEEIGDLLANPGNRILVDKIDAIWTGNEVRAPWVPDHLRQNRQYTGILRATYVVDKDV